MNTKERHIEKKVNQWIAFADEDLKVARITNAGSREFSFI
jgi:hypothetical protein